MLSLIFAFHIIIIIFPPPLDIILDSIVVYLSAFIAFIFFDNFKIALLCSIPVTARNYIGLIKVHPIIFGLFPLEEAVLLTQFMIITIPTMSIIEIFLAKFTVEKLKLRERIGYV